MTTTEHEASIASPQTPAPASGDPLATLPLCPFEVYPDEPPAEKGPPTMQSAPVPERPALRPDPEWRAPTVAAFFGLSVFTLWSWVFGDLPVLAEARDWLIHYGIPQDATLGELVQGVFTPTGRNTRHVSMLVFHALATWFGIGATEVVNAVQIGLIATTSSLIILWLHALSGRLGAAVTAALLWCTSTPVVDALGWQATNHDKTAALFTVACLLVAARASRARGLGAFFAINLGVTLLAALALNSKEIAFVLVGMIPAQAFLIAGGPLRNRLAEVVRFSIPIAFTAGFVALYLSRVPPDWGTHLYSGNLSVTLGRYTDWLLNQTWPVWNPATWTAAVAAIAAVGISIADRRPSVATAASAVLTFGCFVLTVRLLHIGPYLLLIPSIGCYALLAMALPPTASMPMRVASIVVRCVLVGAMLVGAWGEVTWRSESAYVMRHAEPIQIAFREIRTKLPNFPNDTYHFVFEPCDPILEHKYFDRCVDGTRGTLAAVFGAPAITAVCDTPTEIADGEIGPWDSCIYLHENWRVTRMHRGDVEF